MSCGRVGLFLMHFANIYKSYKIISSYESIIGSLQRNRESKYETAR